VVVLGLFFQRPPEFWIVLAAVFMYSNFSLWYFTLLGLGETSLRVRMLEAVAQGREWQNPSSRAKTNSDAGVFWERVERLSRRKIIRRDGDMISYQPSTFSFICLLLGTLKYLYYGSFRKRLSVEECPSDSK
jgi:hypothetical protein